MSIFACLIFMAIAHFSLGCAAPMTEVVATRHSGKIDRSLFEEGKKLGVTYVDEGDTLEIKDRRVVDADDSTVTMDGGVKEFDDVTIEYITGSTLKLTSHPSVSGGKLSTIDRSW